MSDEGNNKTVKEGFWYVLAIFGKMIRVLENEMLTNRNSFGIQAKTRYWLECDNIEILFETLQQNKFKDLVQHFIGYGTNLLFVRDFPGVLIHSSNKELKITQETEKEVIIQVGSGVIWDELVEWAVQNNYYGIENLSLIPGSVGAAAVQNIGAYGIEVGERIVEVQVMDISTGESKWIPAESCQFAYRNSIFKQIENRSLLVISLKLSLSKIPEIDLSYGSLEANLQGVGKPSLMDVRQTIIRTRQSKLPDHQTIGNAGSFFKNPIISTNQFKELEKLFPEIPFYNTTIADMVKIPAAWLIEKAGWKGYRDKSVGVYHKQALVLVNHGEATGFEIWELALQIKESVKKLTGIKLEPEVTIMDFQ